MVEPTVKKELIEALELLSRSQQLDVLEFARSLEIKQLLAELAATKKLAEKKRIRRQLRLRGHRGGLRSSLAPEKKKVPTIRISEFRKSIGTLSADTCDRMEQAIKEGCERIDSSGW